MSDQTEKDTAGGGAVPWCMGGPPVTLLDAVRSTMQPNGGMERPTRPWSPVEVLDAIHERWPGKWALCTVIDVADEMRGFYG